VNAVLFSDANAVGDRKPGALVVDDDPAIRDVISFALKNRGFRVWCADGGRPALKMFWHYREQIDLVLLDINMPGLDGPRTLKRLRKLTTRVHCCFVSGDLGHYTEPKLLKLGAVAVIRKPFVAADLAERMHQLVNDPKLNPSFQDVRRQIVRRKPTSRRSATSACFTVGADAT
jgi:CheY-like chemotaxis protein